MKAEELMINDWVSLREMPELHMKVRSVLSNGYIEVQEYEGHPEFSTMGLEPERILPIPLTPEILEKNGINSPNKHKCIFEFSISKDDLIRLIHIGEGWTVDTKVYAKGVNIAYGYFKYVHELQHALKLCGIEKEIVL